MKRWFWVSLIAFVCLSWFIFDSWQEYKRVANIGDILNATSHINSISVKDSKTKEEIFEFSNSDAAFQPMVEIYRKPFVQLNPSDYKILNEETILDVEYLQDNEVKYVVRVHQLDSKPALEEQLEDSYMYSSKDNNKIYFFGIKENNQLVVVNEGFKELIDIISSK